MLVIIPFKFSLKNVNNTKFSMIRLLLGQLFGLKLVAHFCNSIFFFRHPEKAKLKKDSKN